ncbi:hypothetical protein BDN71DRAFT_1494686 [Pleurotus eryngii]|uniref:Protein CPL1-like domain-containing protein n=1 Tax=Pleurotus eryngii TaxID=5323 RepID=A0A9P6A4D8_PLEER|nr:hypothetical protein BDN71DRAFT_1494686 [Pleurotus eryngii]
MNFCCFTRYMARTAGKRTPGPSRWGIIRIHLLIRISRDGHNTIQHRSSSICSTFPSEAVASEIDSTYSENQRSFTNDTKQKAVRSAFTFKPGMPTCHTSKERACPVYKINNGEVGYKCQFVLNDLWLCSGCPSDDSDGFLGKDRTEIPNVDSVECIRGRCVIRLCIYGHGSSANHTVCIPANLSAAAEGLVVQGLHAKSWHY